MEKEYVIEKGLELIKNSKIALVGSIDNEGFPNIKAMMNLESEGLKKIWFSTNTSTRRVKRAKGITARSTEGKHSEAFFVFPIRMVFNMCKQFNICSSMSSKNLYTTFLQKSGPLSVFVIWLLEKVKYLHEATGSENICMDGGVALNCVANRHILNKGPFNSGRM